MSTEILPHGAVSHRNELAVNNAAELAEVEQYDRLRARDAVGASFAEFAAYRYNPTTKQFEGASPTIADVFTTYYRLAIQQPEDTALREKSQNTDTYYLDSGTVNFIHYPFDYLDGFSLRTNTLLQHFENRPKVEIDTNLEAEYTRRTTKLQQQYQQITNQLLSMLDQQDRNWRLLRLTRRITDDYNAVASGLSRDYTVLTGIPREPVHFVPPSDFGMYVHSDNSGIGHLMYTGSIPLNQYDIYYRRPFDPSGNNPDNFITETVVLTEANREDFSFILPRFAPFFVNSMQIHRFDPATNTWLPLYPNVDYYTGGLFSEMSAYTMDGALLAGTIIFKDEKINGQYRLEYQTLGGRFALDGKGFSEAVARYLTTPLFANWGEIVGQPIDLSTLEHKLDVSDMRGMEDFLTPLTDIHHLFKQYYTEENVDEMENLLSSLRELTNDARESVIRLRDLFVQKTHEVEQLAVRIEGIVEQQRRDFQTDMENALVNLRHWCNTRLEENNTAIRNEIADTVRLRLETFERTVNEKILQIQQYYVRYDTAPNRQHHPYGNADIYADDFYYYTQSGTNPPQAYSLLTRLNQTDVLIQTNATNIAALQQKVGEDVMRVFAGNVNATRNEQGNHHHVGTDVANVINRIPRTVDLDNTTLPSRRLSRLTLSMRSGEQINETASLVYDGTFRRWYGYETNSTGNAQQDSEMELITNRTIGDFGFKYNDKLTVPLNTSKTFGKRELYADTINLRLRQTTNETEIIYQPIILTTRDDTNYANGLTFVNRLPTTLQTVPGIFEGIPHARKLSVGDRTEVYAGDILLPGRTNNGFPEVNKFHSVAKTLDFLLTYGRDETKQANLVRYTTSSYPTTFLQEKSYDFGLPSTSFRLFRPGSTESAIVLKKGVKETEAPYSYLDPTNEENNYFSLGEYSYNTNRVMDVEAEVDTGMGNRQSTFGEVRAHDYYFYWTEKYGRYHPVSIKHSLRRLTDVLHHHDNTLQRITFNAGDLTLKGVNDTLDKKITDFITSQNYVRNTSVQKERLEIQWAGSDAYFYADGAYKGTLHLSNNSYAKVLAPAGSTYAGLRVTREGNTDPNKNFTAALESLSDMRWRFTTTNGPILFVPAKNGTLATLDDIPQDRVYPISSWGIWNEMCTNRAPFIHTGGDIYLGKRWILQNTGSNRDGNNLIYADYYRDTYMNDNALWISGVVNVADLYSRSDLRLKDDLTKIKDPLSAIDKLNGYKYRLKATGAYSYGVVAQEVERVLPELVVYHADQESLDDPYRSVKYDGLVAILLESVKQLQQEVNELKTQVQQLKQQ